MFLCLNENPVYRAWFRSRSEMAISNIRITHVILSNLSNQYDGYIPSYSEKTIILQMYFFKFRSLEVHAVFKVMKSQTRNFLPKTKQRFLTKLHRVYMNRKIFFGLWVGLWLALKWPEMG